MEKLARVEALRRDACAAQAKLDAAHCALREAESAVRYAYTTFQDAKGAADKAEAAARNSPGGIYGSASKLASEVLSGVHGLSLDLIAAILRKLDTIEPSGFWRQLGRMLQINSSAAWSQAVIQVARSLITPETIMRANAFALCGMLHIGTDQQVAWAAQRLYTTRSGRTFRFESLLAKSIGPLVAWLRKESISTTGKHVARLIFSLAKADASMARVIEDRFGTELILLLNAHGRFLGAPQPPPPPLDEKKSFGDATEAFWGLTISHQEVVALPDEARMYTYLYGSPSDEDHYNVGEVKLAMHFGAQTSKVATCPRIRAWSLCEITVPARPPVSDENIYEDPLDVPVH